MSTVDFSDEKHGAVTATVRRSMGKAHDEMLLAGMPNNNRDANEKRLGAARGHLSR
jgi:hypothetical protein